MFAQILLKSSFQNFKGLLVRTITCQVFSLTLTVQGVSNKHCLLTFFICFGLTNIHHLKIDIIARKWLSVLVYALQIPADLQRLARILI